MARQPVLLLLAAALLCSYVPRVEAQSSAFVVSTANSTADAEASDAAVTAVSEASEQLCAGGTTAELAAKAMANATATAMAQAFASGEVKTETKGNAYACGQANARATAAAKATARAAAMALANATCCTSASSVANSTAEAIESKFATATAQAIAESCSRDGGSNNVIAEAFAEAVEVAVANAYAEAVAVIEQCAGDDLPPPSSPDPLSPPSSPAPLATPSPPSKTPGLPPTPSPKPISVNSFPAEEESCTYIVESGDTLSKIASRFDTTVDELMSLNPQIENADEIFIGDELAICASPADEVNPDYELPVIPYYPDDSGDDNSDVGFDNGGELSSVCDEDSSEYNEKACKTLLLKLVLDIMN